MRFKGRSSQTQYRWKRRPQHEVGLLFVHGIGQHRKGSHLEEAASAVVSYLEHPTEPESRPHKIQVSNTRLGGDLPASTEIHFSIGASDAGQQSWLVAESWWSDAFSPPSATWTLGWLVRRAPQLITSRSVESLVRTWNWWWNWPLSYWRIVIAMVWVAASFPLSVVFVLVLGAVVTLRALIPMASVKDAIGQLEVILTGFLGDSLVFAEDPVRRNAMVHVVEHDLDWLERSCTKVVIVAHSQGAAVALEALERRNKPVDTFITFGAGIGQLSWIRSLGHSVRREAYAMWAAAQALSLTYAAAVVGSVAGWLPEQTEVALGLVGFWYGMPFVIAAAAMPMIRTIRPALFQSDRPESVPKAKVWHDLWASADPVSGGPTTRELFPQAVSQRVWNHGHIFRDHTTYLANREEVLSAIVAHALRDVSSGLADAAASSEGQRRRWALRHRRGHWLVQSRVLVAISATLVLVLGWDSFVVGAKLLQERLRLRDWALPDIALPFIGHLHWDTTGAVAIWAIGAFAIYGLILALWKGWEHSELNMEAAGRLPTEARSPSGYPVVFLALAMTIGTSTILFAIAGVESLVHLGKALLEGILYAMIGLFSFWAVRKFAKRIAPRIHSKLMLAGKRSGLIPWLASAVAWTLYLHTTPHWEEGVGLYWIPVPGALHLTFVAAIGALMADWTITTRSRQLLHSWLSEGRYYRQTHEEPWPWLIWVYAFLGCLGVQTLAGSISRADTAMVVVVIICFGTAQAVLKISEFAKPWIIWVLSAVGLGWPLLIFSDLLKRL